jgi:hypothetical protein
MPSDPVAAGRKGGKIGGARNTPAQHAARKRNGFQKRKPSAEPVVEKLRRVVNAVPAVAVHQDRGWPPMRNPAPTAPPRPPKPQPATAPDELTQEATSDDFTL